MHMIFDNLKDVGRDQGRRVVRCRLLQASNKEWPTAADSS